MANTPIETMQKYFINPLLDFQMNSIGFDRASFLSDVTVLGRGMMRVDKNGCHYVDYEDIFHYDWFDGKLYELKAAIYRDVALARRELKQGAKP